jgi:elongation factor Ts
MVADLFNKTEYGQLVQRQLGEKIVIKRANDLFVNSEANLTKGICRHYNHHSNKIAVLISAMVEEKFVNNEKIISFLDDCAMQIAATAPSFVATEALVPQQTDIKTTTNYALQNTIFQDQVKDKPEKMRERIIAGKFEAWYSNVVLLKQESIVHVKKTIQSLQEDLEKELGTKLVIVDFIRYELGV